MIRLLADENIDSDIVRGVLRRRSQLDLLRAQDVGLAGIGDPEVLTWAAKEKRVVLTHDVNTMINFAVQRIQRGEAMAGLFVVHQECVPFSRVIDDLLLFDDCSETAEWENRVEYLPLR